MADFISAFFAILGGFGALVAAVYFIAKALVNHFLMRDIERFKADLKHDHDMALENLKSDFALQKTEHEVRFKKLHDKMANTITELFPLVQSSFNTMASFVSPLDYARDGTKEEKLQRASDAFNKMLKFTHDNRIYLPDGEFDLVNEFTTKVHDTIEEFSRGYTRFKAGELDDKIWSKANVMIKDVINPLFTEIRHRLQEIIGVRAKAKT